MAAGSQGPESEAAQVAAEEVVHLMERFRDPPHNPAECPARFSPDVLMISSTASGIRVLRV